ncbi:hypothetical protein CLOM_g8391, partial [Closterium sp. NIES-68]
LRHGSTARFLEAECTTIDPITKTLSCRAPANLPPPLPLPTVSTIAGQGGEDGRGGGGEKGSGGVSGSDGPGGSAGAAGGDAVGEARGQGDTHVQESGSGSESGGAGGECGGVREVRFSVPYDMLVVAVGATPNTFNVPGVKEHCHFLKSLDDAEAIRNTLIDRCEAACLPGIEDEEQKSGGGRGPHGSGGGSSSA